MGNYCSFESLIYENYNKSIHVSLKLRFGWSHYQCFIENNWKSNQDFPTSVHHTLHPGSRHAAIKILLHYEGEHIGPSGKTDRTLHARHPRSCRCSSRSPYVSRVSLSEHLVAQFGAAHLRTDLQALYIDIVIQGAQPINGPLIAITTGIGTSI